MIRRQDLTQSRASDALTSADAIRRHRAFCEDLAAIGGHVINAHDEIHVYVPEERAAEGGAIVERHLRDYCAQVIIDMRGPEGGPLRFPHADVTWEMLANATEERGHMFNPKTGDIEPFVIPFKKDAKVPR